jgi:uncharacterized protein YoxC
MGSIGGTAYLILFIFGLILAIAWIILPFALIGTKPLLRELLKEQRRTNALLSDQSSKRID